MIRGFARATLAVVLGTALVAAVACDDNDDNGTPTQVTGGTPATQPGTNPTVEIIGTPLPTATFTAEEATAVAAGAGVEMREYVDPNGRYRVDIPTGWTINEQSAEERDGLSVNFPGREFTAVFGVLCLKGHTVEDLIIADQVSLRNAGLTEIDFTNERPIEVAGLPAREVPFRGGLHDRTFSRIFTYFQGEECAWRIVWTQLEGHPYGDLKPIYDQGLASFRLTGAG